MFMGRAQELSQLNKQYLSNQFELALVYGRRRVGKTSLLRQFLNGKESLYFLASEMNERMSLQALENCISQAAIVNGERASEDIPHTLSQILSTAFSAAGQNRFVLVIDECQNLLNACPSFIKVLNQIIEAQKTSTKLFLILSTSSTITAQNQIIKKCSAITEIYPIKPFDFFETKVLCKSYTDEQTAMVYALTGGIPYYLKFMEKIANLEKNIRENYLQRHARMLEDPLHLFEAECRDASGYHSILRAIAMGAIRLNEICLRTGMDTALATSYLNKLQTMGLVRKDVPFGAPNNRKTIYSMTDSMLLFWYTFIYDRLSLIEYGDGEKASRNIISQFPQYMKKVFVDICRQYILRLNQAGKFPVPFNELKTWWEIDPKTKQMSKIDIIAGDPENVVFMCDCIWENAKVEYERIDDLLMKATNIQAKKKQYYIFAKSGFSKECMEKAAYIENLTLVKFLA